MADNRFIVADPEVSASLGQSVIVILSGIAFWNQHYDALQAWCAQNNSEIQGMTVNIPDNATLTAFCLRWA